MIPSTYHAPLLIVRAVDEHTADITHCHGPLRLCQLLVQGFMLLAQGLGLLCGCHGAVHVSLLTQLPCASHQVCRQHSSGGQQQAMQASTPAQAK